MPARILIIEDNPASRDLVTYLLEKSGYSVRAAADGLQGLRLLGEFPADLILCDLQMPALNGFEFIAKLRASPDLRRLQVIAVTAFSMPGDRDKTLEAGFDGYFSKPIEPRSFVADVEAFLPAELRVAR